MMVNTASSTKVLPSTPSEEMAKDETKTVDADVEMKSHGIVQEPDVPEYIQEIIR